MVQANYHDKHLVVEILTSSFAANKSVNYIVKPGGNKLKSIRNLMDYAFEICYLFGKVFMSDDRQACALILYPDKKKTTFKSVWLDIKLILFCIGLQNLKKTLRREALIKKIHPAEPITYLWFIGVHPDFQGQGLGSTLLNELIQASNAQKRPIYLETSTRKNLPWYQKLGFTQYHALDLGYTLFFFRNMNTY